MFAKLLKHEWRACRGILGVLSLAALGVGVIGAVVLRFLIMSGESPDSTASAALLPTMLAMLLMFLIFGLFALVLGSQLFLLYRFYKNKFTDEGYLTFTLPVTTGQIFLASFVNMALWMLIVGAAVAAAGLLMVLAGIISTGYVQTADIRDFFWFYADLSGEFPWWDMALIGLCGVVTFVYALVMAMTCITLGAVIAKKHKILAAFGMYYAVSAVYGMLQTTVSVTTLFSENGIMTSFYLGQLGIQTVMILGGFFLSKHLMKNKLNLP